MSKIWRMITIAMIQLTNTGKSQLPRDVRIVIWTLLNFSLFVESEGIRVSKLIGEELVHHHIKQFKTINDF